MKLRVLHSNGDVEILTLVLPISAHLGSHLNRISDTVGMDYFFDAETGSYDGWGRVAPGVPEGVALSTPACEGPEQADLVEAALLARGLADVAAGRVRPLEDIRRDLKHREVR